MSKLTPKEVQHVARLARLALTPDEIQQYTADLSAILDYARQLQQVDTDHIHPTASVLPLRNVMRTDEARPGLEPNDALANAPAQQDGYFKVHAVLEGGQ
jgi:aspartyl-tRNA(Asn)/glutamyl-tRNA(Gln) amidotransferase subunit C